MLLEKAVLLWRLHTPGGRCKIILKIIKDAGDTGITYKDILDKAAKFHLSEVSVGCALYELRGRGRIQSYDEHQGNRYYRIA